MLTEELLDLLRRIEVVEDEKKAFNQSSNAELKELKKQVKEKRLEISRRMDELPMEVGRG